MFRKSQVRMFETLAVLVVFLLLLGLGSVFYFRLQESSIRKEIMRAEDLRSIELFQKALYLPELDCSFVGVQKGNCFDWIKVQEFSSLLESGDLRESYFDLFGFSKIRVRRVYPFVSDWFVLYENVPESFSSKLSSHSTVLLFDAVDRVYDFGVVEVSFYAE